MLIEQEVGAISVNFPGIERDSIDIEAWNRPESDWYLEQIKDLPLTPYFRLMAEDSSINVVGPDVDGLLRNSEVDYFKHHPTKIAQKCFNDHFGFRLSPQDIGAKLMIDFAKYVEKNQEICAPIFNGVVGEKKTLETYFAPGESLKDPEVLYKALHDWESKVQANTDSLIRDKLHPKFSTQNNAVNCVYSALFLGSAKSFYNFSFSTLCGIPEVRVTGTKKDWEQIRDLTAALSRVRELKEIAPFYSYANEEILSRVVDLYDGKEDEIFWSSIFGECFGSGAENEYKGWLTSLNLYNSREQIANPHNRWRHGSKRDGFEPESNATVDVILL